jgi:hypothetical protein
MTVSRQRPDDFLYLAGELQVSPTGELYVLELNASPAAAPVSTAPTSRVLQFGTSPGFPGTLAWRGTDAGERVLVLGGDDQ